MTIVRLYVVRCKTPGHFYCGTTTRLAHERLAEHAQGRGSRFTIKHGYHSCVFNQIVPNGKSTRLEDDMTKYLMSRFGWANWELRSRARRYGNILAASRVSPRLI